MAILDTLAKKLESVKLPRKSNDDNDDEGNSHGRTGARARKEHHTDDGGFKNPWPSATASPLKNLPDEIPLHREQDIHPSVKRIKVVKPSFDREVKANELKVTWLGHAGVLVQLPALKPDTRTVNLLIDPIWSQRASPTKAAGPERRLENPCSFEELPIIDFFFISHNHYDHLDHGTVKALLALEPRTTRYIVPLGLREWFVEEGFPAARVQELDWWDTLSYHPSELLVDPLDSTERGRQTDQVLELGEVELRLTCVPAQHTSARKGIDKEDTLWAGFVVQQIVKSNNEGKIKAPRMTTVFLAGDTGYRAEKDGPTCPAFKEIGQHFKKIDFASIPIWRGGTLSFITQWGVRLNPDALTLATHATPEDAVCIHKDVNSRSSMGMHFATFAGSEDEATYPISLLEEACKKYNVPDEILEDGGFGVADIGETIAVPVREDGAQDGEGGQGGKDPSVSESEVKEAVEST